MSTQKKQLEDGCMRLFIYFLFQRNVPVWSQDGSKDSLIEPGPGSCLMSQMYSVACAQQAERYELSHASILIMFVI